MRDIAAFVFLSALTAVILAVAAPTKAEQLAISIGSSDGTSRMFAEYNWSDPPTLRLEPLSPNVSIRAPAAESLRPPTEQLTPAELKKIRTALDRAAPCEASDAIGSKQNSLWAASRSPGGRWFLVEFEAHQYTVFNVAQNKFEQICIEGGWDFSWGEDAIAVSALPRRETATQRPEYILVIDLSSSQTHKVDFGLGVHDFVVSSDGSSVAAVVLTGWTLPPSGLFGAIFGHPTTIEHFRLDIRKVGSPEAMQHDLGSYKNGSVWITSISE